MIMFIRNPSSIKQKTITVNNDTKHYLCVNGYIPISQDKDSWIFILTPEIQSLLETMQGGDFGV